MTKWCTDLEKAPVLKDVFVELENRVNGNKVYDTGWRVPDEIINTMTSKFDEYPKTIIDGFHTNTGDQLMIGGKMAAICNWSVIRWVDPDMI